MTTLQSRLFMQTRSWPEHPQVLREMDSGAALNAARQTLKAILDQHGRGLNELKAMAQHSASLISCERLKGEASA
jgi:hypothetical protein